MPSEQYLIEVKLRRDIVPGFEQYPFGLNAVRGLTSLKLHPAVTFLIGENGSGKSTLLEAIAVAWGFNAEGGSKNFAFNTHASHSELHKFLRLSRGFKRPRDGFFLRAESFFNVASEIQRLDEGSGGNRIIDSYGGTSLHGQSHGESFLALFNNRFGGQGFYILDEPEAALSPSRQMAMLTRMHQLVRQSSQFIIATHSPIVMAYPDAIIYQMTDEGPAQVAYQSTEHFQVMRDFLKRPDYFLNILLDEDDEDGA
jgi:predicted ATPase